MITRVVMPYEVKKMRYMLALTIALLSSLGYVNQSSRAHASATSHRVQTGSAASRELASFSPHDIKKFIGANGDVNLNPIWNFYGIPPEPFERYNERYVSYEAEVFPVSLQGDASADALLRIWFGSTYRYLIFRGDASCGEAQSCWKYAGYVDIDGQQYAPPEHRVVNGGHRSWLILKELWGRGTGVIRYGETWYEVGGRAKELKTVMHYPVKGHQFSCQGFAGRSFDSKVIEHGLVNGNYEVRLEFSVSYDVDECTSGDAKDESPPLFSKTQKATYVWNSGAGKFVLVKSKSELSDDEIDEVYNFDSLDEEGFLKYNFQELKTLATQGDAKQKEWLQRLLLDFRDSKRKQALVAALAQ